MPARPAAPGGGLRGTPLLPQAGGLRVGTGSLGGTWGTHTGGRKVAPFGQAAPKGDGGRYPAPPSQSLWGVTEPYKHWSQSFELVPVKPSAELSPPPTPHIPMGRGAEHKALPKRWFHTTSSPKPHSRPLAPGSCSLFGATGSTPEVGAGRGQAGRAGSPPSPCWGL